MHTYTVLWVRDTVKNFNLLAKSRLSKLHEGIKYKMHMELGVAFLLQESLYKPGFSCMWVVIPFGTCSTNLICEKLAP